MSLCSCRQNQNEFDDIFYDEIILYADTVDYKALIVFPAEKLNHNPDVKVDGYVTKVSHPYKIGLLQI